jgi:excisionase family DNA binding protein
MTSPPSGAPNPKSRSAETPSCTAQHRVKTCCIRDPANPGFAGHVKAAVPGIDVQLPEGLSPWLVAFVREALGDTLVLQENGAEEAAAARTALIQKLMAAASSWLDTEIGAAEAAEATGLCQETIRRAVRDGNLPDRRPRSRGRHRIRRGDLEKLATHSRRPYDANADAQDIARLRRAFP